MKLLSHYMEYQAKLNPKITNWENHIIGDNLSYSYRKTTYDRSTYPSNLHYHDYYELVVFEEGDIRYVCEGQIYHPQFGDIILIPPRKFHMSAINCENTCYKRHVFYLYPSAFDAIGHSALTDFLSRTKDADMLTFNSLKSKQELMGIIERLKELSTNSLSNLEHALMLSLIIQIFYLLNQKDCLSKSNALSLPENIVKLQQYIDNNFAEINSISQVGKTFFYSREHVSRLFKKYFDISISDYLMKKRISESQALIVQGIPLINVAYQVGFGSLSSFIRAFRAVTGITPKEYRKLKKEVRLEK